LVHGVCAFEIPRQLLGLQVPLLITGTPPPRSSRAHLILFHPYIHRAQTRPWPQEGHPNTTTTKQCVASSSRSSFGSGRQKTVRKSKQIRGRETTRCSRPNNPCTVLLRLGAAATHICRIPQPLSPCVPPSASSRGCVSVPRLAASKIGFVGLASATAQPLRPPYYIPTHPSLPPSLPPSDRHGRRGLTPHAHPLLLLHHHPAAMAGRTEGSTERARGEEGREGGRAWRRRSNGDRDRWAGE